MSRIDSKVTILGLVAVALVIAGSALAAEPQVETFTLVSGAEVGPGSRAYFTPGNGNHGFFGQGGAIDGQPNPTLRVKQGDTVKIILLDKDQRGHSAVLAIPDLGLSTPVLTREGQSATLSFVANRPGRFKYTGKLTGKDAQAGYHAGLGRVERHINMVGQIVVDPK